MMPLRAIIAIITRPSHGSISAYTTLRTPIPFAYCVVGFIIVVSRPRSKFRAVNFSGTRSLRPYPDAVQGANKHYVSYIFFHGSIGFLVFSSFVVG
jgi:hypothetical protein